MTESTSPSPLSHISSRHPSLPISHVPQSTATAAAAAAAEDAEDDDADYMRVMRLYSFIVHHIAATISYYSLQCDVNSATLHFTFSVYCNSYTLR